MKNVENKKFNSFVDLAKEFLPKNYVAKFEDNIDRQISRELYFHHKNLYEAQMRKLNARRKQREEQVQQPA